MRLKRSATAILAVASLFALAACGSGGGSGSNPAAPTQTQGAGGGAGAGKNPDAKGPLAVPADAAAGGTVTVLTSQVPATFDPTRAYYTDSTSILNLVTRALTEYAYNPQTKDMELVPDMATDLGTHNKDMTEWSFTLKDGLKYEDGSPVKAADIAYAISRSFAIEELPDGPTYQLQFFLDGDKYKGPYKDKSPYKGVTVDGNTITIKMSRPFPDMDYYASFPTFTGIPQAKDTKEDYGNHPLATGPYMFKDYKPGTSLTLVKNPNWDPATDPGRIQSADEFDFEFNQDQAKTENIILSDNGDGQTTVTYDNITPPTYKKIETDSPDRLVTGTSPCTYMWYLDMTKITDINVRKAIGYAYPYVDAWKAGGEIVGLTRVPGTSILPPGTAGRVDYDALGIQGQNTDPAEGQGAAAAGQRHGLRDQVPLRDRRPAVGGREGPDRQGSRGRWLQGHADRVDVGQDPRGADRLQEPDQRPLQRLVLGLAVGWLVVPGPVGRLPGRPGGHAQPVQLQGGGRRPDAEGHPGRQEGRPHEGLG